MRDLAAVVMAQRSAARAGLSVSVVGQGWARWRLRCWSIEGAVELVTQVSVSLVRLGVVGELDQAVGAGDGLRVEIGENVQEVARLRRGGRGRWLQGEPRVRGPALH